MRAPIFICTFVRDKTDYMNKSIITIDHNTHSVEYSEDGFWYKGSAYPVSVYDFDEREKVFYISKKDGGDILSPGATEDIRVLFEFSFCYRGVWEGRIYFKDDEYWSEELMDMAKLWDEIQIVLKEKIKVQNPEQLFVD